MAEEMDLTKRFLHQKDSYSYYEGCPGCKVDRNKRNQTGLPIKYLLLIWFIVLSTALTITSLFPFVYFMVKDFDIAKREEDIGFYVGIIGASFMVGRALTSILWGVIADRYGRKIVIIISCASTFIFNTLFGLSVNFWMAVTTRFLLGSLNGLLGPIKAYACELVLEEYQALGLSAFSTAWGTGLIVGPALGGYLAQPEKKFPGIFSKDSIFSRFPYFLPCLITSTFSAIVTVVCFWIPETLHSHPSTSLAAQDSFDTLESAFQGSYENLKIKDQHDHTSKGSLLRNWPLMSSILVFCIFSLHDMAYTELFSIWAESPRGLGGLSYTTQDVGTVLSISGASLLVFQSSLYPMMERMFGPIRLIRILGIMTIPLLTSYHYIAKLNGIALSILINFASILKNVFSTSIDTGLIILQNRAVSQNERGVANGIAMTLMSIFKSIGPAGGGALFSWAQKRQRSAFLPGDLMVFFVLCVIEAIGVLFTFKPFLVDHNGN